MKQRPSLNALRIFCEVADRNSFTRAANELGVTQSAVSKQVARLEAGFGKSLFQRDHKKISLTPFGAEVATAARVAFAHLERRLAAIDTPTPDQIRFAGDADFIQLWLAPRLHRFERAHPSLRVSLSATIGLNQPPDEPFDCAVIWGRGFWRDVSYEPLMGNTAFPVAAPNFFDHLGRPPRVEDIDGGDLIHDQSRLWWASFRPFDGDGALSASAGRLYNQTTLCLEAAARGEGVTIGDEVSSRAYLEEGRLVCPFQATQPSQDRYFLVRSNDQPLTPQIAHFAAWLRTEVEEHRAWYNHFWSA